MDTPEQEERGAVSPDEAPALGEEGEAGGEADARAVAGRQALGAPGASDAAADAALEPSASSDEGAAFSATDEDASEAAEVEEVDEVEEVELPPSEEASLSAPTETLGADEDAGDAQQPVVTEAATPVASAAPSAGEAVSARPLPPPMPPRPPQPVSPFVVVEDDAEDDLSDSEGERVTSLVAREQRREEARVRATGKWTGVARPWFETAFDETHWRMDDQTSARQIHRECRYLAGVLELSPQDRVLDVGCGQGHHALQLAQAGVHVTGLDLSFVALRRAARRARELGIVESTRWWQGDMRELGRAAEAFDAAYLMRNTFGYFEERGNLEVLQSLARRLRPGGRLVLDVFNRDAVLSRLPRRAWWEADGVLMLDDIEFDPLRSRLEIERSLAVEGEEPWRQEISVRVYSLHELRGLLQVAGFRLLEGRAFPAVAQTFFADLSLRCLLVAERAPG